MLDSQNGGHTVPELYFMVNYGFILFLFCFRNIINNTVMYTYITYLQVLA